MISLIIPTIGSKDKNYFSEAIDSTIHISQDIVNEILIVNNSDNIDFINFVNLEAKKDDRIRIIHENKRLSIAQNWNLGLTAIKNKWHLYLHDDDILNHEEFNNVNHNNFKEVGFYSYDFYILNGTKKKYIKRDSGINGIIENTPKFVSTIFNTKHLKSIGGWDNDAGYFLDILILLKLHTSHGSNHQNTSLGEYRIHKDNASKKNERKSYYSQSLPYVLNECYKIIDDKQTRRLITFHLVSFAYPNTNYFFRFLNTIIRAIGNNAWFKY